MGRSSVRYCARSSVAPCDSPTVATRQDKTRQDICSYVSFQVQVWDAGDQGESCYRTTDRTWPRLGFGDEKPMNKTEMACLSAAINQLRPDWQLASIKRIIWDSFRDRAYRDAALVLVWVAVDPETRTPARAAQPGPWWQVTRPAGGPGVPQPDPMHSAEICRVCRKTRAGHDHMAAISDDGHAFTTAPETHRQTDRTGPRMVHGSRTTHQDTTASTDALASAFPKENPR